MTTLPEEAVKAAKDVLYYANPNDIERALTAAAPHLSAVRVKKLEWREDICRKSFISDVGAVSYSVFWDDDAEWCDIPEPYDLIRGEDDGDTLGSFETADEAKAAAQADYEARILSALEPSATDMGNPITLTYTNYRGETSERAITPIRPWFGSTEWHPEPQWLLRAYDHDKGAERDFALKDFGRQQPSAARELALVDALEVAKNELQAWIKCADENGLCVTSTPHVIDHIDIALASLSSPGHADAGKLVEGDGWMPIESAPNNNAILVHYDDGNIELISADDNMFSWIAYTVKEDFCTKPTHWRPLPLPPVEGGKND